MEPKIRCLMLSGTTRNGVRLDGWTRGFCSSIPSGFSPPVTVASPVQLETLSSDLWSYCLFSCKSQVIRGYISFTVHCFLNMNYKNKIRNGKIFFFCFLELLNSLQTFICTGFVNINRERNEGNGIGNKVIVSQFFLLIKFFYTLLWFLFRRATSWARC